MSNDISKVFDLIKENDVKYVDLRFTDPRGKWQHTAQHVDTIEEDTFSALAEWFVNEQVGLSLAVSHSEVDGTDIETDAVELGARIRF